MIDFSKDEEVLSAYKDGQLDKEFDQITKDSPKEVKKQAMDAALDIWAGSLSRSEEFRTIPNESRFFLKLMETIPEVASSGDFIKAYGLVKETGPNSNDRKKLFKALKVWCDVHKTKNEAVLSALEAIHKEITTDHKNEFWSECLQRLNKVAYKDSTLRQKVKEWAKEDNQRLPRALKEKNQKALIGVVVAFMIAAAAGGSFAFSPDPNTTRLVGADNIQPINYGEKPDITGLKILYENHIGQTKSEVVSADMLTYDSEKIGAQTVFVRYGGETLSFEIEILPILLAAPAPRLSGEKVTWPAVSHADAYEVSVVDAAGSLVYTNTVHTTEMPFPTLGAGDYEVFVTATTKKSGYTDSSEAKLVLNKPEAPVITRDALTGQVTVSPSDAVMYLDGAVFGGDLSLCAPGVYTITARIEGDDAQNKLPSDEGACTVTILSSLEISVNRAGSTADNRIVISVSGTGDVAYDLRVDFYADGSKFDSVTYSNKQDDIQYVTIMRNGVLADGVSVSVIPKTDSVMGAEKYFEIK